MFTQVLDICFALTAAVSYTHLEDDMAKSTKTYEERIRALEKKEQESIEATKKLIAQRKELEKRKKAEESKKRTHRLCQIGGAVESVLGLSLIHILPLSSWQRFMK